MNGKYVKGIFIKEAKNRFICVVDINGISEECYIPSSCRLENFLELTGKEIVLRKNITTSTRTRFTVYAIRYKQNFIILRSAEANDIIRNSIHSRRFSFLGKRSLIKKECIISGYKTDLFLPETRTIIEIKSIITVSDDAIFPTVYSERAINQFHKIKELIMKGYKVIYTYVSLNPYVKQVHLSQDKRVHEYVTLISECVQNGMQIKAFSAELKNNEPVLKKEIKILL